MSTAVGDEGGFAPDLPTHAAAIELILEAIGARRLHRRAGRDARARLRRLRVLPGRATTCSSRRSKKLDSAQFVDYLGELASRYPIVSIEDGMAENDWDGWKLLTEQARRQAAAGRRRRLRHQPAHLLREGIEPGRGQRHPDQGQPDRHAHRDLRRDRAGQARRLRHGDLAPLGRDRGHHHRRHRGGHRTRCRSRPARCRAPTASPSTTSCCASRKTSATR